MVNLVFEGPDNSGKSTLVRYVASQITRPVVLSEGPDKYPGEMNERILRYERHRSVIFDRHPCVSQAIYSRFRGNTEVDADLMRRFYDSRPLFIYCRGRGLVDHVVKEGYDTDEHLKAITENDAAIRKLYDSWAATHAHIWYRVGDSMERVLFLVQGYIKEISR